VTISKRPMRSKAKNPSMSEADVTPQIVQAMLVSGCQLFRNNVGCAKFGQRWVRYGVGGKGGSDHIGYLPVRVTEDMVGKYLAVFVGIEAKRPIGGDYRDEQIDFMKNITAAGGIAGFAKSWEDARWIINKFFARFAPVSKNNKKRLEVKTES
jgi:hypothetical protein